MDSYVFGLIVGNFMALAIGFFAGRKTRLLPFVKPDN